MGCRREAGTMTQDLAEGDFVWVDADSPYLVYRPPGVDMVYTAFVTTDKAKQYRAGTGTYWWWNGDRNAPTLRPSIAVPAVPPYRWHGWLKGGVWEACE